MKKQGIALLLVLSLLIGFSSFGVANADSPLKVAGLVGPTGMSLAPMMEENKPVYAFSLAASPDELAGQLIKGGVDIAALPTNLAAVLYQKTKGEIKLLAVNTLGILYVLEKGDSVHGVKDLEGKKLLTSGQGAVPEYVMNYILTANGVKAELEYRSEHNEVSTLAAAGKADLVVLPQPMATALMMKNPSFRVAIDLTKAFEEAAKMQGEAEAVLSMGCLVVRASVLKDREKDVQAFMEDYRKSVEMVNAQPDKAAEAIAKAGILPSAAIAQKAIPLCNIVCVEGETMKNQLAPFYQILFTANPMSVGGKLPDEGLYYIPSAK